MKQVITERENITIGSTNTLSYINIQNFSLWYNFASLKVFSKESFKVKLTAMPRAVLVLKR